METACAACAGPSPGYGSELQADGNVLFNDALNTFYLRLYGRKDGNVLFNNALNTFYLPLYGVGRKEMFYLMTHSTYFIYSYIVSDGTKCFI